MNVKNIGGNKLREISSVNTNYTLKSTQIKQSKPSAKSEQTDKLELSPEAKNLAKIKNKINEGFYNQTSIIQETSKEIFKKYFK
ncbi:MAG: hypothetical protein ACPLPX_02500 [Candidatus Kapaibacteriota bacterium]|jgi:hypothetical protein